MAVALIYGKSGAGKTVNSTLTEGKNLLMDSDNSSVVLKNFERPNTEIIKIPKILQQQDNPADNDYFIKQFETTANSKKHENIIIDNLTDIIDRWLLELGEVGKNRGVASQMDYQVVYYGIKRLVRAATLVDVNVIFNAWQDTYAITKADGTQISMVSPKLPQKILENICGLANIVAKIETVEVEGKQIWFYRLQGSETVYAKDQLYCRKTCKPEDIFNGKGVK
ncbi:MAG: AAA family ATPase [Firmicutes bacterium]|nr:AAA family ATPase [Bacillota bacterium]